MMTAFDLAWGVVKMPTPKHPTPEAEAMSHAHFLNEWPVSFDYETGEPNGWLFCPVCGVQIRGLEA